jgi:hypothetical protein
VLVGSVCKDLIDLGGYPKIHQDSRFNLFITGSCRGGGFANWPALIPYLCSNQQQRRAAVLEAKSPVDQAVSGSATAGKRMRRSGETCGGAHLGRRRMADDRRRRTRTAGGGCAPVDLQGRKADLRTRLGIAVLAVVPDCSDSTPGRRIGRGNAGGASSTAQGRRRSGGAEGRKAAARARGFGDGLK